jgi:nicotinate dehydrogenase subunit A
MDSEQAIPESVLLVNAERWEVRTEPETALLYVLRNHLGLKGTRFGCGLGLCGACMVLVDGHIAFSCDTPLWSVLNKTITTVEGLGTAGRPHPLTRALIARQAAQCGFCMSGIIIAAAELLDRNSDPSDEEVRVTLDRNLCRCGLVTTRYILARSAQNWSPS